MSNKKYSITEVANIVGCEGLGYAIEFYLGADAIEDNELSRLWQQADELLGKINEILQRVEE